jgi:glucosylceramidase
LNQGGPNWAENTVDAPIIVLPEEDSFLKQPMFYALGHISRYMPEGSFRVHVEEEEDTNLKFVGVERPDGGIAIVFLNR